LENFCDTLHRRRKCNKRSIKGDFIEKGFSIEKRLEQNFIRNGCYRNGIIICWQKKKKFPKKLIKLKINYFHIIQYWLCPYTPHFITSIMANVEKMYSCWFLIIKFLSTVKLGYNDHGYNEFTIKTNKIMSHFWSQMTGYKDWFHGYNEHLLMVPECSL